MISQNKKFPQPNQKKTTFEKYPSTSKTYGNDLYIFRLYLSKGDSLG